MCIFSISSLAREHVSRINIISMCSIKIDMMNMNTKRIENVYVSSLHLQSQHLEDQARRTIKSLKQLRAIQWSSRLSRVKEWAHLKEKEKRKEERVGEWEPLPHPNICVWHGRVFTIYENTQLPSKNNTLVYRQEDLNRYSSDSECRSFVITNSTPTDTWHNYSPGRYKSIIKRNYFPFNSMAAVKTELSHCVCKELVSGHSLHSQNEARAPLNFIKH